MSTSLPRGTHTADWYTRRHFSDPVSKAVTRGPVVYLASTRFIFGVGCFQVEATKPEGPRWGWDYKTPSPTTTGAL